MKEKLSQQIRQYFSGHSRWKIISDAVFIMLLVLMIIPSTRMKMIVGVRKLTMQQPVTASVTESIRLQRSDLEWQIQTPEGLVINFKDLNTKPVFLNFWAVKCPHCIAELESIENLYHIYKDKVNFILLTSENPIQVKKFLNEKGYKIPFYLTYGNIPGIFDTPFIPATFIITTDRKIVLKKTGPARWDGEKMISFFDKLTRE